MSKNTNLAAAMLGLALGGGCMQREIISKPSPIIDPMVLAEEATPSEGADPLRLQQWNLTKVALNEQTSQGSPTIKVALLSTGVDYNHEDLRGRISVNTIEQGAGAPGAAFPQNGQDDDGNGLLDDIVGWDVVDQDGFAYDRRGNGTAMAGILAARRQNGRGIAGLLNDVRVYPIRYIDDNGQTGFDWLVAALRVAAASKPDIVVIQSANLPTVAIDPMWGVPVEVDIVALEKALLALRDVPVVIGAGNNATLFGESKMDGVFRHAENVLVVTSSDKDDRKPFVANHNSTFVLTSAPGQDLISTKPLDQYGTVSSTAFAATHVAGAIALAMAKAGPQPVSRYMSALVSAQGSDRLVSMEGFCLGRNRLNVEKFLAQF